MTEEEEFFAWLDGELRGEQAASVEARVAASPQLTARAEQHRRLAARLSGAFEPLLQSTSAPPRFEAEVLDFGAHAAGRKVGRPMFGVPQWAAMAATLVVGLLAGDLVGRGRETSPIAVQDGQLVAAAALSNSLDTELASAPNEAGFRAGLTFRNRQGNICRSFQDGPSGGLACRKGQQWRVEGLFQGNEGQASDYRMAAGSDPRLSQLIEQTIAGEPFDAAQEKAARDKGWR